MSNYAKIMQMKNDIQAIRKELNELKKLAPTEENARRVIACEKRIREIKMAIIVAKRSYGFAA